MIDVTYTIVILISLFFSILLTIIEIISALLRGNSPIQHLMFKFITIPQKYVFDYYFIYDRDVGFSLHFHATLTSFVIELEANHGSSIRIFDFIKFSSHFQTKLLLFLFYKCNYFKKNYKCQCCVVFVSHYINYIVCS